MTEWGVIGVIITLIGLIAVITKPLINLNTSIVKLTDEVNNILSGLSEFKKRYVDNLNELKERDKEQQIQIDNHENRIIKLESHVKEE